MLRGIPNLHISISTLVRSKRNLATKGAKGYLSLMRIEHFAASIRNNYEIHEWRHESAILEIDFRDE